MRRKSAFWTSAELKQRRTLNARRICDANFEAQRAADAVRKLRQVQGQHEELWSSDAVAYAEDYLRLAVHAQELKVHIDAERETMAELRGFYVSEHLVWQEASRESAVPWKRCDELVAQWDHVRMSRHGVLVAGKERLMHQVREVQ